MASATATIDKKKRVDKKNRLDEIEKPRGFSRGLDIEEIVGATDYTGDLMFLIKWQDCVELDLLPANEVIEKSPQDVIKFSEKRSPLIAKLKERNYPNIPIIPAMNTEIPVPSPEMKPTVTLNTSESIAENVDVSIEVKPDFKENI